MFRKLSLFLILTAGICQADQAAVEKYRDYLPEQLLVLPESELKNSVPMMYSGAANLALSTAGDLSTQASLNSLMYDGFADYEVAKRAFQTDLGEEVTGKLTVWQIHTLEYRASRLNMTYVSFFPFDFGGTILGDYATVEGAVEIIDEKIAYPINHVEIKCNRVRSICEYRQIVLMLPDENSWVQSYHIGEIVDETYKIINWSGNQIDAVPFNDAACRTNQLSLNFNTQEFFEISRNGTAEGCDNLPRLDKPRVSRIIDGRKIADREFDKMRKEAFSYYSNAFQQRLTKVLQESEEQQ